jgi:hypothetical protein
MTKTWGFVSIVLALLLSATPGCVRAQAKAKVAPTPPPLEVPPPPPRIVEPTDAEMPPPVGLVGDQERIPLARPRASAPAPRSEPKPEVTRPEAAPEAAKPSDEPRPPSPTTLQTTPTEREGEVEARIRAKMNRATADLARVNYQTLGVDAKTQFDTAKGFIKQADDALKARNLLFAGSLADKAAALAAQLAGR